MNWEEASEVSTSAIWDKICKELDGWIDFEMAKLRNCAPQQLEGIQQTIRNYERVKNLPQIVKDRVA